MFIFRSIILFVYLSVCLSLVLSRLCICPSLYLTVCLSVVLSSIILSIHLSVSLSVCLSVCPSVELLIMELLVNSCLNVLLCKYLCGRVMFRCMVSLCRKKSRLCKSTERFYADLMFLLPALSFLPLPGCHLLPSHLSVAHSLTPSSYDCFLMALPFYFSLPYFFLYSRSLFLSLADLLSPIPQFSVATTSTRQQMKTVENKSEEETVLSYSMVSPNRGCIFILCSKSFFSPTQSTNHLGFASNGEKTY